MNDDLEFINPIVALLDTFGEVEANRMFGGFGIFHAD
jgi:TfoX/Sxy family transcriptional regulator of competence genes